MINTLENFGTFLDSNQSSFFENLVRYEDDLIRMFLTHPLQKWPVANLFLFMNEQSIHLSEKKTMQVCFMLRTSLKLLKWSISSQLNDRSDIWVFHEHTELTIVTILASEALLHENKKTSSKMLPSEYWTWDLSHLDLMLSSLSYWGKCYLGYP